MAREQIVFRVKSGLGPAPGMRIDGYLEDEDREVLYERWQPDWPAPVEHQGGLKVLTCEKVKSVGYSALSKIYGVRRAKVYIDVAEANAAF